MESSLDPLAAGQSEHISGTSLFHRRIDFHLARKSFNGFGNCSGGFRLETLNSTSNSASGPGKAPAPPNPPSNKASANDGLDFDPELSLNITFRKIMRIGAGLENLGNTCFLNAVLQCLTYTEPLAAYLESGKHQHSCRKAGFCALCAIQRHVSRALQATGRILAPKDLVSNLRCISRNFRNARQEDAHEYMVNLLESMHKCCLPSGVPSESPGAYEKSLVHRMFGGRLRSRVKCMQCSYCSDKYDPFLDLSLEILKADSLYKALEHFTAPELLDGGEKQYSCQQCKQKVRARKQLSVDKAPHVLTIHLKRFGSHLPGKKIDKKIHYGPVLDLNRFMSSPHTSDLKYTLYAVLVHAGWSTHSGHYYCFVRTSSGMWYSLDDNQLGFMLCLATAHHPADAKDTETIVVQSLASTLAHSVVGRRLLAWSPAVSYPFPGLRLHPQQTSGSGSYNVQSYGAKPDGKTDSTKAFVGAWAAACASTAPATIYVPAGSFLVGSVTFGGQTCKNNAISFEMDGTLVAPSDYNNVIGKSGNWIKFEKVTGVSIFGGTLDGQGAALWACKNSANNCPQGATTLAFYNSNNVVISGLSSQNSQMFHILIDRCHNAKLQEVKISAPGNSPNTDGIHVQSSTGVTILNSHIGTGDDCISVGPGNSNLWIENIACGPGHGISIGSLGKEEQEGGVQNVTVKTATFTGTQNGLRIKTWAKPSNGFVKNVVFQHAVMSDVQNPIIIDQNYCPNHQNCPHQSSGVKISDIKYEDIHGTSATEVAMKFDCSNTQPCSDITLDDVNLTYKDHPAQASCSNAGGTSSGLVTPASCL